MTDFLMIIIVSLLMLSIGLGIDVKLKNNQIAALKTELNNCDVKIETQDAAVIAQNNVEKNVQSAIVKTEQSNTILSNAIVQESKTINKTPIITDCSNAIKWSAQQAHKLAIQFQKAKPLTLQNTQ